MTRSHHPRRTVQRRPEIVIAPQLRLARSDPHPHRQTQPALRIDRRVDRAPEANRNAAHTPSPVCLNNQPPCALDRRAQHLIMGRERRTHRLGIGLPTTR